MGRGHAALGEHSVSVAALDAASDLAKVGRFLLSECLCARARALVGREAGGVGGHWSQDAGHQRLSEVLARMALREEDRAALLRSLGG